MTDQTIEDLAVVKEMDGEFVLLEVVPAGSCDSCAINGICGGKNHKVTHRIKTDRELKVGQKVRIEISSGLRVASSLLLFLFPILTMVLFYFIGKLIHLSEELSIFISFAGLLLSGIALKYIDKKMGNKLKAQIVEVL